MDKELVFSVKDACVSVKKRIENLMQMTNGNSDNEFHKLLDKISDIELNINEENAIDMRNQLIDIQDDVDNLYFNSQGRKI